MPKINIQSIWDFTNGGRVIIEEIYPASVDGFNRRKNFSIRPDDKKPSCAVFKTKGSDVWLFQDKGGNDNKAYNAVQLLAQVKGCSFSDALKICYDKYANGKSFTHNLPTPIPKIEKTDKKTEHITIGKKSPLTAAQLCIFGPDVTAEHATAFSLFSLDYYITKEGYKISSTKEYHIFYYDYGSWGKIYQPEGEYRFLYVGKKTDKFIFSDIFTSKRIDKIIKKHGLHTEDIDADSQTDPEEKTLDNIVICTGPSDAINVYAQGFNVVWFNSETEGISDYQFTILRKLIGSRDKIYMLPDMDATGIRMATGIATRFLDIHLIWLPDRLAQFKTAKGKPCKDVKDFFHYYRDDRYTNNRFLFKQLVRTAQPLKFWLQTFDDDGKLKGFEINNESLYSFLKANGFYTIDTKTNKNEFAWIHIRDNVITEISDKRIAEYINEFLILFLKRNLAYYDIKLINTIHRTNQLKVASLSKLSRMTIDVKSFGKDFDHLFFRNFAIRISPEKIEPIRWINFDKQIFDYKIIDFDFKPLDPLFEVTYEPVYQKMIDECQRLDEIDPVSSEAFKMRRQLNEWPWYARYSVKIKDNDFSLLKYLYNTGRVHWKKEEKGLPLSVEEQQEHNLHFISKVCALGYAMYRYKDPSMAWALYAMETDEDIDSGRHMGGTGKSFFLDLIKMVRNVVDVDGQKKSLSEDKHIFGRVVENVTDFVIIDDLGRHVPLNTLFVPITGNMNVEPKFVQDYSIPYKHSPKIGFTSNHPMKNFDASLRRRIWFLGFSSYYHPADDYNNISERSMRSEFGKTLIDDYTPEEMNKLYNLLAQCMHTFLKFGHKINPPMQSIERRNLKNAMGDEFFYWADDYFTPDRLNTLIRKDHAYEDFIQHIPAPSQKFFNIKKFKDRLIDFCKYNDLIFNPPEQFKSESEKKRNDIRGSEDGKDVYYFFFKTK